MPTKRYPCLRTGVTSLSGLDTSIRRGVRGEGSLRRLAHAKRSFDDDFRSAQDGGRCMALDRRQNSACAIVAPAGPDFAHVAALVDVMIFGGRHLHDEPLGRREKRERREKL